MLKAHTRTGVPVGFIYVDPVTNEFVVHYNGDVFDGLYGVVGNLSPSSSSSSSSSSLTVSRLDLPSSTTTATTTLTLSAAASQPASGGGGSDHDDAVPPSSANVFDAIPVDGLQNLVRCVHEGLRELGMSASNWTGVKSLMGDDVAQRMDKQNKQWGTAGKPLGSVKSISDWTKKKSAPFLQAVVEALKTRELARNLILAAMDSSVNKNKLLSSQRDIFKRVSYLPSVSSEQV